MLRFAFFMGFLGAIGLPVPSTAEQSECREPSTDDWLRQPVAPFNWQDLEAIAIRQVRADALVVAVERLSDVSVVALSDDEVERLGEAEMVGRAAIPTGWRPYLIRSVFPVGNPRIDLNWQGEKLVVDAFGLGCAAFTKHPIIVYLDRAPTELFVTASAAL